MAKITHGQSFARRVVGEFAGGMAEEAVAVVRHEDVEAVHRLRVVSRRLRNAMEVFKGVLPGDRYEGWLRRVRKVTRALGEARDLDVRIGFVGKMLSGELSKAERVGLERLELRLRQQREAAQKKVVGVMERLGESGVTEEMRQWAEDGEKRGTDAVQDDEALKQEAGEVLLERQKAVLKYEPWVEQEQEVEKLHELRIAIKHWRYTMEVLGAVYGEGLKEWIGWAKKMQTVLGDIHDCDTWSTYLPQFMEEEQARHEAFFGDLRGFARLRRGVSRLLVDRQNHRRVLYRRFVREWKRDRKAGRWGELEAIWKGEAGEKDTAVQSAARTSRGKGGG